MAPQATPLILIGGSVRAAAEDAAAAGYRVIALDRFGDRDLQAVCHRWQQLAEDWTEQVAAWPAAPIVPTGGFTWPTHARAPTGRLIAYPAADVLKALSDPAELRELAADCGIDFPMTMPADRWQATVERAKKARSEAAKWLVKPRVRTGGIGIRRWDAAVNGSLGPQIAEDVQQWVAGRPLGASYIARRRQGQREVRLLGACMGLTHCKHPLWPWLYAGSIGPQPLASDCYGRLLQVGQRAAQRFQLVGLFNVDFMLGRNGSLVLLEINPRYSASMELVKRRESCDSAALSTSLIDWHLAAYQEAVGHISTADADERMRWADRVETGQDRFQEVPAELACKRIVYAPQPLRIDRTAGELAAMVRQHLPSEYRTAMRTGSASVSFHDLPPLGQEIAAGHPALTVVVRGGDTLALARSSRRIARELCGRLRSR